MTDKEKKLAAVKRLTSLNLPVGTAEQMKGESVPDPEKLAPRQGWSEDFKRMAEKGDDALLDAEAPTLTCWDEREWEWWGYPKKRD